MKKQRKKISTILPADLLREATEISKANQTDTLILGLQELVKSHKRKSILDLKGRLKIDFDINQDRERSRF